MANIIIKSDERRAYEDRVMRSFGVNPANREQREAAEIVAARSSEAYNNLKRTGGEKQMNEVIKTPGRHVDVRNHVKEHYLW